MVDDPDLEHFIGLKGFETLGIPLLNLGDGGQNVAQAIQVASHKADASR